MESNLKARLLFLFPWDEFFHSKSVKKAGKTFMRTCSPTPISSFVVEGGHTQPSPANLSGLLWRAARELGWKQGKEVEGRAPGRSSELGFQAGHLEAAAPLGLPSPASEEGGADF